jgi:glycosyltransferase involved in cell wall biosynthesis
VQPLVTLGVPVYNGESCLRAALDSLVAQTYRNLEILICDNASTDGTAALCAELAAREPRIRYVRNDTNLGIIGKYRRVFALSTGEYFTWAAADDIRPPEAIQTAVDALERNPDAVMVHGAVGIRMGRRDLEARVENDIDLSSTDPAARVRSFARGLAHNAMLYGVYRREALARATLGKHYGQDYLVCLKLCQLGPVEYVASPLVVYRQRPESIDTPMYPLRRITLANLLFYRGVMRNKCWKVLLLGCYYLLADRKIAVTSRVRTTSAYVTAFSRRFWRELLTESVFIAFAPIMWVARPAAPIASRLKAALRPASTQHVPSPHDHA